jgi:hypothetical protein
MESNVPELTIQISHNISYYVLFYIANYHNYLKVDAGEGRGKKIESLLDAANETRCPPVAALRR